MSEFAISQDNLLWAVQVVGYIILPLFAGWLYLLQRNANKHSQDLATTNVKLELEVKRLTDVDTSLSKRLDHIDAALDNIQAELKVVGKSLAALSERLSHD